MCKFGKLWLINLQQATNSKTLGLAVTFLWVEIRNLGTKQKWWSTMGELLILVMSTQPFLHKPALQNYKMIHKKGCCLGSSYLGLVCLLDSRIALDVYFVIIPISFTVFNTMRSWIAFSARNMGCCLKIWSKVFFGTAFQSLECPDALKCYLRKQITRFCNRAFNFRRSVFLQ